MARDFARLGPWIDLVPYRNAAVLAVRLPRSGWVLDVGGGTGRVARRLGRRVVVADAEPAMLRRARAKGLDCVVADASRLPFKDGSADAVLVVDALHHLPDAPASLADARRVLGDGGRLLLVDFDAGRASGRLVAAFERIAGWESTFRTAEELARLVAEAGFGEVRTTRMRGFETLVEAKAPGR